MKDSKLNETSWFDQVKIQAEVLLPVLRVLRAELGVKKANKLIYSALREWMKNTYKTMANEIEGSPQTKWRQISEIDEPTFFDDLEVEVLLDDTSSLEFNITGCRYAEYFRQLGEPELGAILNCEADEHIASIGEPEVIFARSQTKMGGASHCDFRYQFNAKTKK
jgi:L-2-amino-thiazoline-4-carboxylic acid hydrolase